MLAPQLTALTASWAASARRASQCDATAAAAAQPATAPLLAPPARDSRCKALHDSGEAMPQWWVCSGAVYDTCFDALEGGVAGACRACVTKNAAAIAKAGCTDSAAAAGICEANNITCPLAVKAACPGNLSQGSETQPCQACAQASARVAAAGCSSWLVNDVCYTDDDDNSVWGQYIDSLACLMNGTWYSTQKEGECGPGGRSQDCWWRVAETKRTVNQSCVDARVVDAVRKARGEACWQGCGAQANNQTSRTHPLSLGDSAL